MRTRDCLHDPFVVDRVGTVLLRDMDAMDRLNGAFDTTTHTVDVRPMSSSPAGTTFRRSDFSCGGWIVSSPRPLLPVRSGSYFDGFYFSPIGNPAPLFTNPEPVAARHASSGELQVQTPIRKIAFFLIPETIT